MPNMLSNCPRGRPVGVMGVLACGGALRVALAGQGRTRANETRTETKGGFLGAYSFSPAMAMARRHILVDGFVLCSCPSSANVRARSTASPQQLL